MRTNKKLHRFSRCMDRYQFLVESGLIESDEDQICLLERLDLFLNLVEPSHPEKYMQFRKFWPSKLLKPAKISEKLGIYIHGGVGTGKSMLMDIFYSELSSKNKLRTHFHSFMQDTHDQINSARIKGFADPISTVAKEISRNVSVLCFDEFQITDITDAMLVGRLFSILIGKGTFIIITSNRHPDDLYKDGLNRKLFLPFIDLLKKRLQVADLNACKDYRRAKLSGRRMYFSPINNIMREEFDNTWFSLAIKPYKPLNLSVKGRTVKLSQHSNGVLRCSFTELCGTPLGALDYLKICENIKVLFIEYIPILSSMGADSAKRFVTLIDTLYEKRIKVICLAEQKPEMLYPTGKGSFEFERTISRLYEMQSENWIAGFEGYSSI